MSTEHDVLDVGGVSVPVLHLNGPSGIENPSLTGKLIPKEEVTDLGDFLRRRGKRIAFTTGVYDMLHIGHARYLERARSLGDVLVVGLNTDVSVKRLKGPHRPILDEGKRAEMLSFLGFVDYITLFDEDNGANTIRLLRPQSYLCVEGSWEGDLATKGEVIAMAEVGGSVYTSPRQGPTISTSAIIDQIGSQIGNELMDLIRRRLEEGFRL